VNETPEPAGIGVLIDSDDPVPSGQGDCANFRVCHRYTRVSDGLLIEDEPDDPLGRSASWATAFHCPMAAKRARSTEEGERRPFFDLGLLDPCSVTAVPDSRDSRGYASTRTTPVYFDASMRHRPASEGASAALGCWNRGYFWKDSPGRFLSSAASNLSRSRHWTG
jgi:hypothetical protein